MDRSSDHNKYEALARSYQSGSREALKELIRTFNPQIESKIYFHTKDKDSVRDISQECWYVIINNLEKVKFQIGFEAWALNIARNKSVDWIRNQQKERRNRIVSENEIEDSINREEKSIQELRINELKLGMQLLSNAQRIILELFYVENLSLSEIAEVLEISAGTVKSRLFYAREQLKKIIK